MVLYQNDISFNMDEHEAILSNDLIKYVNDDRLLNLSIQTLYRIVSKYVQKNDSNNSKQPSEFIEFLFKCLDHFGREASVLFDKIDSFGSSGAMINRLLENYSEKFDFGFVNKNTLKTVYQLENEIITREKKINHQISTSQQEMLGISKHVCEQIELMKKQREDEVNDRKEVFTQIPKMVANEIEELRKKHEEEEKNRKETFAQIPKIVSNQIEELKKKYEEEARDRKELFAQEIERLKKQNEEEMKKKDEMIMNMLKKFEEIQAGYKEELRKQREDFDVKMKKIDDQLGNLMNKKITRLYHGDPAGLISLLGNDVTLSLEKKNAEHSLVFLRAYNYDVFSNDCGRKPSSESDTIINFDFGSYKKVDLRSYFIRSCADSSNGDHPKTWRIEGSNDSQSWTMLDRRSGDGSLNGRYRECYFICQNGHYGSKSNLFRYIRFVQEDSWLSDTSRKYFVCISYFELYGDVVTI